MFTQSRARRVLALILLLALSLTIAVGPVNRDRVEAQGGAPRIREARLSLDLPANGIRIDFGTSGDALLPSVNVPLTEIGPFLDAGVLLDVGPQDSALRILPIRVSAGVASAATPTTRWQTSDELRRTASGEYATDLFTFAPGTVSVQVRIAWDASPGTAPLTVHRAAIAFIDPSASPPAMLAAITNAGRPDQPSAAKPSVISRTGWGCPDGQIAPTWPPEYFSVHHLIVHHTATPNGESDWAARVRSIWYYHAVTLGWGDIGYNYLIDVNGTVYEGRAGGDDVKAAHDGVNAGSLGVSLIGSFQSLTPPPAMLNSLTSLLAWKAEQRGIDPLGSGYYANKILPTIAGHRDVNTTECPGNTAYAQLPGLRTAVKALITPPTGNQVRNPDFSAGFTEWWSWGESIYSVDSGVLTVGRTGSTYPAVIGQTLANATSTGPYEIGIEIGSTGADPVMFTLALRNTASWDGAVSCTFTIPPNSPRRRYSVRGRPSAVWSTAQLEMHSYSAPNSVRSISLDNAQVVARPDLNPSGTECYAPLPLNDTVGVFRPGTAQFLLRSINTTGPANIAVTFGAATDIALVGDWNGDGIDTVGLYRPATREFMLKDANTDSAPVVYRFVFGLSGDLPVVGDWDGDGRDSVGLYRDRRFFLRNALSAGFSDLSIWLDEPGDLPLAGDWNGDGKSSPGLFNRTTATFALTDQVCNCIAAGGYRFRLGDPGDVGFVGDWDGDGKESVGVFRPTNGITYLRNALSTGFADVAMVYGIAGDSPLAGCWSAPTAAPGHMQAVPSAPPFKVGR